MDEGTFVTISGKKDKTVDRSPKKRSTISPPKKKSLFSKTEKLVGSDQKYANITGDGTRKNSSPSVNVYENPSFSLYDESRVRIAPADIEAETNSTQTACTEEKASSPEKTVTESFCKNIKNYDILLPVVDSVIYHRPHVPAPRVHRWSNSQVDDRTPLYPTQNHSKINKILDHFICWRRDDLPIRKNQISWPVIGSLKVRGPDEKLQDALIGLSVDDMLTHIVRTESEPITGYTKHNPDDGIFRRISSKSNRMDARLPTATTGSDTSQ